MSTRHAADNAKALDAFMTTKFQIDAMLERLKALSDDHFEAHPDECKCWIKIPQKCWCKIPHLAGSAISRRGDQRLRSWVACLAVSAAVGA